MLLLLVKTEEGRRRLDNDVTTLLLLLGHGECRDTTGCGEDRQEAGASRELHLLDLSCCGDFWSKDVLLLSLFL